MGKLVLIGGGHAHLLTLQNIHRFVERGFTVDVIGSTPVHYYSGMGPGMLAGTYMPEEIRFATRDEVTGRGGRFILDTAEEIMADERRIRLKSGEILEYDILSCNCGSEVLNDIAVDDSGMVFQVKPIENLLRLQEKIVERGKLQALRIAIIGGGPSAAEIAGNILHLASSKGLASMRVSVLCRHGFMDRFSARVQRLCRESLMDRGGEILTGQAVERIGKDGVIMRDGRYLPADMVCLATGVWPSSLFSDSGLPTGGDGGLLVNGYLQCGQYPEIFGGGDCISFAPSPLDKVGVYAVRQNPVLLHNLLAALEGRELQSFSPGSEYLRIFNLGQGIGVLQKGRIVFSGRLAFFIKDFIDRRFMRRFQYQGKINNHTR